MMADDSTLLDRFRQASQDERAHDDQHARDIAQMKKNIAELQRGQAALEAHIGMPRPGTGNGLHN